MRNTYNKFMGNNTNKQPTQQPHEQQQEQQQEQPTLVDSVQSTTPQNTTQNTLPTTASPHNPITPGTQNTPPHGIQDPKQNANKHTESNKKHEGPLHKVGDFATNTSSNVYGVGHNAFDTVTHRHKGSNVRPQ
jgi:hypothetical protein